jgi:hypothetical protein
MQILVPLVAPTMETVFWEPVNAMEVGVAPPATSVYAIILLVFLLMVLVVKLTMGSKFVIAWMEIMEETVVRATALVFPISTTTKEE